MQATIVDLRYHMKEVLKALGRNEEVTVLYHNKKIASIKPLSKCHDIAVKEHAFFGMLKHDKHSVKEQMDKLRGGRYHDI